MRKPSEQIVEYFLRIYNLRLTTASGGNISIKKDNVIYVSPSGGDKGNLTPEDISIYDPLKKISLNSNKPTCEINMHTSIYEARNDINTIIHAHPPFCSLFSILKTPLRIDLLSESYIFLKNIEYVPYFMPSSIELASHAAEKAKLADVLILRNHGVICLGNSLEDCFHKLEVLEASARIHYQVLDNKEFISLSQVNLDEIKEAFFY